MMPSSQTSTRSSASMSRRDDKRHGRRRLTKENATPENEQLLFLLAYFKEYLFQILILVEILLVEINWILQDKVVSDGSCSRYSVEGKNKDSGKSFAETEIRRQS